MAIYYSPSKNGFFDENVGYNTLPDDIIKVNSELHQKILNEVNRNGKKVVVKNGKIYFESNVILPTWKDIRRKRNNLLTKSDYTQMSDWPGDKKTWAKYRQELRDITKTFSSPDSVIWPKAPS